jgi:hypothetical protein
MSIPLDRLYHYIESIASEIHGGCVLIYRFWPYGSKKFIDLLPTCELPSEWKLSVTTPDIYCNDQEPLNFDLYENIPEVQISYKPITQKFKCDIPRKNFRPRTATIWDHAVLLHSEQRSPEVEKYLNCDFLPVYYWSHAVIAQDWFRYARYIRQQKNVKKLFLIYSRGWTGTREYRLKFLELIANSNLNLDCQTSIQPVDHETSAHYQQHVFLNQKWKPKITLEPYFPVGNAHSNYSADFDIADYENTEIEVVLETLFDDSRLHFTEKILRPLALAQPFILVSSHGGLEYLRQYGFKTFSSIWSEEYDLIQDPEQRLHSVIDLMKSIKNWTKEQRQSNLREARSIVEHNRQRFFSSEFFKQVTDELKTNLKSAFENLEKHNTSKIWRNLRQKYSDDQEIQKEWLKLRSQQDADEVYAMAEKYYLLNQNKQ